MLSFCSYLKMAENSISQLALQDENVFQQLSSWCYYKTETKHKYELHIRPIEPGKLMQAC